MNLIEAVKSGRPFRRSGRSEKWIVRDDDLLTWDNGERFVGSQVSWLLADDWEIQEPEVRVTRTQFWEAWAAMLKEAEEKPAVRFARELIEPNYGGILAKRLGLE